MTDLSPLVAATPGAAVGMRDLSPAEAQHLERLRAHLRASGAPVTTVAGLGGLLAAAHAAWARTAPEARTDPSPMISSIGVGVGDLVLAGAPAARWVLRVDGGASSPALLSPDGSAAVLPFADVRRRWLGDEDGVDTAWLEGYVTAAAAYLAQASTASAAVAEQVVPTQRSAAAPEHADEQHRTHVAAHADEHASRRRRASHAAPDDEQSVRYRTPQELPHVPSAEAQNLALRALDRGLAVAMTDGPRPFALRDDGTTVHVRWFDTGPDEALALAEAWVADGVGVRASIGWAAPLDPAGRLVVPGLGAVPDDEAASAAGADHAVVVLTSDLGKPGLVVAHRYAAGAPGRVVGQPLVVGPCPPII